MADAREEMKKKLIKRFSPLGMEETIVPKELQSQFFDPGTLASTDYDQARFREEVANNPDIVSHERIHVGQYFTKQPSIEDILKSLGNDRNLYNMAGGGDARSANYEVPAYKFSSVAYPPDKINNSAGNAKAVMLGLNQQQQDAFNKYIDFMSKYNNGNAQPLEMSMPRELMTNYVKDHPKPLTTAQPSMLERSLLDVFLNRK